MGTWMIGKDEIELGIEVDEKLIEDFIRFTRLTCPESYRRELFSNPWFFTARGTLASLGGKFAEPSVWYKHLRKLFFEPRGIYLPEDIDFLFDGSEAFHQLCMERQDEWFIWDEKMSGILADQTLLQKTN